MTLPFDLPVLSLPSRPINGHSRIKNTTILFRPHTSYISTRGKTPKVAYSLPSFSEGWYRCDGTTPPPKGDEANLWLPFDTHGGGKQNQAVYQVYTILRGSLSCLCPPSSFLKTTAAYIHINYAKSIDKETTPRVGLLAAKSSRFLRNLSRSFPSSYTTPSPAISCFPGASTGQIPSLTLHKNNDEQNIPYSQGAGCRTERGPRCRLAICDDIRISTSFCGTEQRRPCFIWCVCTRSLHVLGARCTYSVEATKRGAC